MKRVRLTEAAPKQRRRLKPLSRGGDYFPVSPPKGFIPSGGALLDCVLGGGWALGRVSNIVGDKSTGKTLLAIEASANFAGTYKRGRIWYREAEAAFDKDYAEKLGLPVKRIDFGEDGLGTHWSTVEDVFEDLQKQLEYCREKDIPGLYIVDSLDALSSRAEQKRKVGEGTFGLEKQKLMGELFRTLIRKAGTAKMHILFISQVRDRIGVTFGEKHTRTGGRSLDFYASQVLWLSHLKTLKKTVKSVSRATGVRIKAKCKKNKITTPFRDCEFTVKFGYGIDDLRSSVEWLDEVGMLDHLEDMGLTTKKDISRFLIDIEDAPLEERQQAHSDMRWIVFRAWDEVESRFRPKQGKYA